MRSTQNAASKWQLWLLILALSGATAVVALPRPVQAQSAAQYKELYSFENPKERRIRELREEEINQLRIALGRRLPTNRRADLYFRLAEVYLDAYRTTFILEGRLHSSRLDQGKASKLSRAYSMPFLRKGIQACQELIDLRIAFPKMDRVYYFLAFNYGELGEKSKSLHYYQLLTSQYAGSLFAVEAFRELGFHAFEKDQFKEAIAYLEQALRLKQIDNAQELKPVILHRLAWSYYRTRQPDNGIEMMKQAVAAASKDDERFLSIREEALRDMAVFMTERGQVDEAISYFSKVAGGKSYYPRTLEKLGDQYRRRGESDKAVQVFESLLRTHPNSEVAFAAQVKLVDLDIKGGQYEKALTRVRPEDFPDEKHETLGPALIELRSRIRRVATEKHEAYRKGRAGTAKKDKNDLKIANLYYTTYMKWFLTQSDPKHEKPEIQMYLAEVKNELGDASAASELYKGVLESGDTRYAKEAGTYWVASLSRAIGEQKTKGEVPSAKEREFVSAADDVVKSVPNTLEARESALRAAQVLAGYRKTREESIDRLASIIERWPGSQQGLVAAQLWLQLRLEEVPSGKSASVAVFQEKSGQVRKLSKDLLQNEQLMAADKRSGDKLRSKMIQALQDTRIGLIATYESNRDFEGAAREYLEIAQSGAQGKVAEKAFENAIGSYVKAGQLKKIDPILASWKERFPRSTEIKNARRNAATILLIEGHFDDSARIFEDLGQDGDMESLALAARIYAGMERHKSAQKIWNEMITRLGKSPRQYEIALLLGQSYELLGEDREAARNYQLCMRGSVKLFAECGSRLADLHLRLKNDQEGLALYRKVAKTGLRGQNAAESAYFGYAWYQLAVINEKSVNFPPFSLADDKKFQQQLAQRTQFFGNLNKAYNQVVQQGGPWAVAALHRQALWTLGFARDVDAIQPQKPLEGKELAQFRATLSTISGPLRKQALETWRQAYAKASQSEVLSPALPVIADTLAELTAKRALRAQGSAGGFRISGVDPKGGETGSSRALQEVRGKLRANAGDSNAWVDYGNLLLGEGRRALAKVCYQRALDLNSKSYFALNNWAVVLVTEEGGAENWVSASEAAVLFRKAIALDAFYMAGKLNMAQLLNYYRIFSRSQKLIDQVLVKQKGADISDAQAVALFGLGQLDEAEKIFKTADESGLPERRFVRAYHRAAAQAESSKRAGDCLSSLDRISETDLKGFEKESYSRLFNTCTQWKEAD